MYGSKPHDHPSIKPSRKAKIKIVVNVYDGFECSNIDPQNKTSNYVKRWAVLLLENHTTFAPHNGRFISRGIMLLPVSENYVDFSYLQFPMQYINPEIWSP